MPLRSRLSYANVTATLALFLALGGASYAAVALPAGSVGTHQLRAKAVTASKLAPSAARKLRGPRGRAGARGLAGARGIAGAQGSTGLTGETGRAGTNGTDGADGLPGAPGTSFASTLGLNATSLPPCATTPVANETFTVTRPSRVVAFLGSGTARGSTAGQTLTVLVEVDRVSDGIAVATLSSPPSLSLPNSGDAPTPIDTAVLDAANGSTAAELPAGQYRILASAQTAGGCDGVPLIRLTGRLTYLLAGTSG